MRLSDSIEEYVKYRRNTGYAKNTTRVEQQALDLLLLTVGNIQTRSLDAKHGEAFVAAMTSKGLKPSTTNLYRGAFGRFCKWAMMRKYLPGTASPLGTTRNLKVTLPPRRRVPASDFARLLDAADHPQSRIIVALGLYLMIRSSAIIDLDVEHVSLDEGFIRVFEKKTGLYDLMPISKGLDRELRRWLTWYANDVAITNGPLQPHWPLVPARRRTQMMNDGTGKFGGRPFVPERGQMNPLRRAAQIHGKVQDALRGIGWEVGPDDREGVHTLRRSGALALYKRLVSTDNEARDEAIGTVQAVLHHKAQAQTEHYMGLEAKKERRDRLLRGMDMFGEEAMTENVVQIAEARAQEA